MCDEITTCSHRRSESTKLLTSRVLLRVRAVDITAMLWINVALVVSVLIRIGGGIYLKPTRMLTRDSDKRRTWPALRRVCASARAGEEFSYTHDLEAGGVLFGLPLDAGRYLVTTTFESDEEVEPSTISISRGQ